MKSLFASVVLGVGLLGMGCASEVASDPSESQAELTARSACRGKSEGQTCRLCAGNDPDCIETMEVKTCQKNGAHLRCSSDAPPAVAPYDPCAGKSAGDNCHLCAPNDRNCVETMEVKTCGLVNGKLACNAGAPTYDPCAGKRTGASCTICDPSDKDCFETMVEKTCRADGVCSDGE